MSKTFCYEKNRKGAYCSFPPEAYEKLGIRAKRNDRSISREITHIVSKALQEQDEQGQTVQSQQSPELTLK